MRNIEKQRERNESTVIDKIPCIDIFFRFLLFAGNQLPHGKIGKARGMVKVSQKNLRQL